MFDWLTKKPTNDRKDKAALIKEAMLNAEAARNAIGQETLDKLAALMQRKKEAEAPPVRPMDKAKAILEQMDKEKLALNIKTLLDEKE
jgi:hypothetical protein